VALPLGSVTVVRLPFPSKAYCVTASSLAEAALRVVLVTRSRVSYSRVVSLPSGEVVLVSRSLTS
jgi:hypothetical protein